MKSPQTKKGDRLILLNDKKITFVNGEVRIIRKPSENVSAKEAADRIMKKVSIKSITSKF